MQAKPEPTKPEPYRLDFEKFPLYISTINLPKGAVVYRATKTNPMLPEHPRFYSDFKSAKMYTVGNENVIWKCTLNKLRLLDIRMMRNMVVEALLEMRDSKFEDMVMLGNQETDRFGYYAEQFMLAYGLRPMSENIKPFSDLKQPFQNFGLRTSIFDNDDIAVALLKFIFYPIYAGYIAPQLIQLTKQRPFHHEICLFNPSDGCISDVVKDVTDEEKIEPMGLITALNYKPQGGGDDKNIPDLKGLLGISRIDLNKTEKKRQASVQASVKADKQPKTIEDVPISEEDQKWMSNDESKDEDTNDNMYELSMIFETDANFRELAKRVQTQLIYNEET